MNDFWFYYGIGAALYTGLALYFMKDKEGHILYRGIAAMLTAVIWPFYILLNILNSFKRD